MVVENAGRDLLLKGFFCGIEGKQRFDGGKKT